MTKSNAIASNAESNGGSESIKIRRSDRVFIVGKTGSGKTTLATTLLARLPWVVVLDPKHQFTFDQAGNRRSDILITKSLAEADKHDDPTPIIYRPDVREAKAGCEDFWEWIWLRENTIVYVDEVTSVSPTVNMPYGYQRAIQQGRGKNIGVWSATQRPARIPTNLLTEAEHVFAFELRALNDLKRMAEYTDPIIIDERVKGFEFYYYSVRNKDVLKLNKDALKLR